MSKEQNKKPTPTKGVPVELDRTRKLRYTLGKLEEIKTELGDDALEGELSGDKLARVIWHGLVKDDPGITPEYVRDELIDLENLEYVTECMAKALGQKKKAELAVGPTMPLASEQEEPQPEKQSGDKTEKGETAAA